MSETQDKNYAQVKSYVERNRWANTEKLVAIFDASAQSLLLARA